MPDLYTAKPTEKPPKTHRKTSVFDRLKNVESPFSAFVVKPDGVSFENQRRGEAVLLVLRKHWITNLGWVTMGIFLVFMPLIFVEFPVITLLPTGYKLVVFISWYLLLIAFLFEKFLIWFFDVGVVTDQRVIDIDFYGLIYKEVSEANLEKIQDVTLQQIGAIRTVFDFGNVIIQTAAETNKIDFEDIPHPQRVSRLLEDLTR